MPRRKSVPSLENLCLHVATTRFQHKQVQNQLKNQPSKLLNNIYEKLCQQSSDTDRAVRPKTFIHSGAMTLHHLHLFDIPTTTLFAKISQVCTRLVQLDLETFFRNSKKTIPSTSIVKLIQNLPKLERLNLRYGAGCNDQVAASIGTNCPLMAHLDISHCTRVTDVGLRSFSCCVKLEWLDIAATRGTVDGCLFLLNKLKLKLFHHDFWPELLNELAQRPNTNIYFIEQVPTMTNENISILKTVFPHLKKLRLFSDYETHLNNSNSLVWPGRLVSLELFEVRPVNIRLIDRAWPMLEKLTLVDCTIINENASLIGLRQLYLRSVPDQQMKLLLVQCRNLECARIVNCRSDLISELVELNALQCVRFLALSSCHLITPTSILKFLRVQNPLKVLFFRNCNRIDNFAFSLIQSYVKSKNLGLDVLGSGVRGVVTI